jgi:hypothetical protein
MKIIKKGYKVNIVSKNLCNPKIIKGNLILLCDFVSFQNNFEDILIK